VTQPDNSTPSSDDDGLNDEDIACLGMWRADHPSFFERTPAEWDAYLAAATISWRPQRRPRLKTVLDQARKAGATSATVDGVTYTLGQATEQLTGIDRELAEFGRRRHGTA
jgi:hypothetical protein